MSKSRLRGIVSAGFTFCQLGFPTFDYLKPASQRHSALRCSAIGRGNTLWASSPAGVPLRYPHQAADQPPQGFCSLGGRLNCWFFRWKLFGRSVHHHLQSVHADVPNDLREGYCSDSQRACSWSWHIRCPSEGNIPPPWRRPLRAHWTVAIAPRELRGSSGSWLRAIRRSRDRDRNRDQYRVPFEHTPSQSAIHT